MGGRSSRKFWTEHIFSPKTCTNGCRIHLEHWETVSFIVSMQITKQIYTVIFEFIVVLDGEIGN